MKYRIGVLLLLLTFCFTLLPAQRQKGKASYYSKRSTGARTSSGERLHHDSLTCAHRTHPFGTLLKVTNPTNGKEVLVKVTDRGPFHRGRLIDLSYRAAKELGILSKGVSVVVAEPVEKLHIPFKADDIELPELSFVDDDEEKPEWTKVKIKKTDAKHIQKLALKKSEQSVPSSTNSHTTNSHTASSQATNNHVKSNHAANTYFGNNYSHTSASTSPK